MPVPGAPPPQNLFVLQGPVTISGRGAPDAGAGGSAFTFDRFASAVLQQQLADLMAHEAGARSDLDPENLHAMRVALRRLRAALSLCASVLPAEARELRRELGWVAGILGSVRDLDVERKRIADWSRVAPAADRDAYEQVLSLLADRRSVALARMIAVLDSPRYQEITAAIAALAAHGSVAGAAAAQEPLTAIAPGLIRGRWRQVRAAAHNLGPKASTVAFHRFRIRCKRLRDALEFLAEVYGSAARPLLRRLLVLHDVLGLHQDAQVATAHLNELRRSYGDTLTPKTAGLLKALAQRYVREAEAARQQTLEISRTLAGKPWQRLRRALKAGHPRRGEPVQRSPGSLERPRGFPASGDYDVSPERKQRMDLYLIRHAAAGAPDPLTWPDDRDRTLTPQGKKRVRSAARGLRRIAPEVALVLSSPLARAWQTARVLEKAARWPAPLRCEAMAPEGMPGEVVRALVAYLGGEAAPLEPPRVAPEADEMPSDGGESEPQDAETGVSPILDLEDGEDGSRLTVTETTAAVQPEAKNVAVALVGHEPNLHQLASYLLTGDPARMQLTFKRGGVACLSWEGDLQPGSAVLRWLLTPRALRSLDA